ncbi:MAG: transcriptional repressor [Chloroflexota bacterium]
MAEPQARLDELIARLRERGGRLTPQRVAVLKVLATSDQHPSAEQIYEHVKADFPMTSLATVYKTLALLVEMGELLEIRFCGDSTRYDGRIAHSHPHLICVKCKKIEDLELAPLNPLSKEVAERTGYCILRHRLDFFGICPECQEEE